METEYHEIEFDSKDCVASATGTKFPSDVTPNFFLSVPLKKVVALKVIEAQIPFSYYVFNSNNNYFYLIENTGGVSTAALVTIPAGNYDSSTILSALKTALEAVSPGLKTYTVTYSSLTMRLTISNNNGAGDYFSLFDLGTIQSLEQIDQCCLKFLGIARDASRNDGHYYYARSNTGANSTLTLTEVLNLGGPNYIYLCSNRLGGQMDIKLPNNGLVFLVSGGYQGPQICKIPMTTDVGTVTNWQDPHPEKWFSFGGDDLQGNIDFFCTLGTDNWLYPIDFNGVGFSFKLGVITASGDVGQNYQSSLGQATTKRVESVIPMRF